MNPDFLGAFGRLADAVAVDEAYFAKLVDAKIEALVHRYDDAWCIRRTEFNDLHPALQRRLLREAFRHLKEDTSSLSHQRTLDLLEWINRGRTGAKRDAGASIELQIDYENLWILRRGQAAVALQLLFDSQRYRH